MTPSVRYDPDAAGEVDRAAPAAETEAAGSSTRPRPRPGARRSAFPSPLAAAAAIVATVLVVIVGATAAGAFADSGQRLVEETDRMCRALHTARTERLSARLSGTRCPTILGRVAGLEAEAARSADRWADALDAVTLPADLTTRAAVFRAHLRANPLDTTLAGACPALAADIRAAIEDPATP